MLVALQLKCSLLCSSLFCTPLHVCTVNSANSKSMLKRLLLLLRPVLLFLLFLPLTRASLPPERARSLLMRCTLPILRSLFLLQGSLVCVGNGLCTGMLLCPFLLCLAIYL